MRQNSPWTTWPTAPRGNPEGCDHAGRSRGKRANMPRERQCQRLHQGDRRYSHVRRQPAQHHQRTRRGRQVGDRQPGTQTRVRQVSRPSQTSRQGAAPSSATPAFNGAKLRFQTTLTSLKMTFATFSQPDNRPYRKSIPPSTKTRKSLLTGSKLRFGRLHPRTSAFAPYLAYIWQIRQSDRRHFLTKSATCNTLFPNRHLPNPVARLRRIHHDAPSQTFPSDALYWPWAR